MQRFRRSFGALIVVIAAALCVLVPGVPALAATSPDPAYVADCSMADGRFVFPNDTQHLAAWACPGQDPSTLVYPEVNPTNAFGWSGGGLAGDALTGVLGSQKTATCSAGWFCAALIAAGLGQLAWSTHDTWLPWLEEQIAGGAGAPAGSSGTPTGSPTTGSGPNDPVWPLNVVYTPSTASLQCYTLDPVDTSTWGGLGAQFAFTAVAGASPYGCLAGDDGSGGSRINCYYPTTNTFATRSLNWGMNNGNGASQGTRVSSSVFQCPPGSDGSSGKLAGLNIAARPYGVSLWSNDGLDRGFTVGQIGVVAAGSQLETTVTCYRPDGSTYAVVRTSDANAVGVLVGSCSAGGVQADGKTPVDTAGSVSTVEVRPDGTRVPQSTQTMVNPSTPYPDCQYQHCTYVVRVNGQICSVGVAGCDTWTLHPETATCSYGPYSVPVGACASFERSFEPSKVVPLTAPNTDGRASTWTPPQYVPAAPTPTPSPTSTPVPTSTATATATATATPTPTASSTATTTTGTDSCVNAARYNLGAVQPQTAALVSLVAPMFGITTVYGWREDPLPDHPSGLAADFMVNADTAKGQSTADYVQSHAAQLGVQYLIWQQHIWNIDRASEGWRLMDDRGSPTANHMDHVHVTMKATATGGAAALCSGEGGGGPADENGTDPQTGECFPTGWGLLNPIDYVVKPLKCLFIPKTDTVAGLVGQLGAVWKSKPPGSVIAQVQPIMSGLGDGWSTGPACNMPDFAPEVLRAHGMHMKLPCSVDGMGPGSVPYTLQQAAMGVSTAIVLWQFVAAALGAKATGETGE